MEIPESFKKYVEIPDRVYKFFSLELKKENLFNSIKDNYLQLSKPIDFNDPFDCTLNLIDFKSSKKDRQELLKTNPLQGNRKLRRSKERVLIKRPDIVKKAHVSTWEELNNEWRICCFTKNYRNNLMWSHYAANRTGICMAFDPKVSANSFLKVKYTNHFEPINYFERKWEALLNMTITKSLDWEYEEEVRTFRLYSGKLPFPKESLKEVIFGCKTKESDKSEIINLLSANNYNDVVYKQAFMRNDSFLLGFKEFK